MQSPEGAECLVDGRWNVTALVDLTAGSSAYGEIVERYIYDPYGNMTVLNGTMDKDAQASDYSLDADGWSDWDNEIGYGGYRLDPETGLWYSRRRYYNSTTGTWAGRDPEVYADGPNLYAYCAGDPIGATDPMGLASMESGYATGDIVVCSPWGWGNDFEMGTLEKGDDGEWRIRAWNNGPLVSQQYAERWVDGIDYRHTLTMWKAYARMVNEDNTAPIPDITDMLGMAMEAMDRWCKENPIGRMNPIVRVALDIDGLHDNPDSLVAVNGRVYRASDVNYVLQGAIGKYLDCPAMTYALGYGWKWAKYIGDWDTYGSSLGDSARDWISAGFDNWRPDSGIYPRTSYSCGKRPIEPFEGYWWLRFGHYYQVKIQSRSPVPDVRDFNITIPIDVAGPPITWRLPAGVPCIDITIPPEVDLPPIHWRDRGSQP